MKFYARDLKGREETRLSFNPDFFLFLINVSNCLFVSDADTKELAKGFRFKMT